MSDKGQDLLQIPQDDYLNSYETCRLLCDQAVQSHQIYWKLIDVCEEHIRGKKPKDPDKLKKAGMHWANNWNFLKARSKITKVVLENIDLVKDAIQMSVPEFKRDSGIDALDSADDRGVISMKISRVFLEALEKESHFNSWINSIEYPSTAFGYDAVIFDGEDDWMGFPVHPSNIAFEDQTEPDNIGPFVIFKTIKARFLWSKWIAAKNAEIRETIDTEEPTDIRSTNWSVSGLEAILWKALSDEIVWSERNKNGVKDWEEVVHTIQSGARSIQTYIRNTNNVRIARIFYKELSKKWTETYIPYLNDWQNQGRSDEESGDKIIYKKKHGKKHQDQLIILIKDSSFTEGNYIHELRGLAKYSVEDSIRFNRKKNNIEDKLIFSGSPMFEQQNTQQKEQFKITPSQGFTMVKSGFQLTPDQPQFDLTNHLLSIEMDEKHFRRETDHLDPKLEGKLTSRPVKDEVTQKSKEVQATKSSKNSVKFSDYSKLTLNILKNLAKVERPEEDERGYNGYEYFYDELAYELRDFIPENDDSVSYIKGLIRSVVSFQVEPVTSDIEALQIAISMSETSYARNRLKRMLLMAQGFPRKEIDRIAPLPDDTFRNMRDERVARFENDMFWTSGDAIATGEDDHIDHLNEHYRKAQNIVQGVSQARVDVVQGFKFLANLMSHAEMHLGLLDQDPTLSKQYEELFSVHEDLLQVVGQIKSMAEQEISRREKEQQNQIPPEKLKELQLLEMEKVEKMRRTEELTKHKQGLQEQGQAHKQALERNEQAHEQGLERRKAEAELQSEAIKTAAQVL